MACWNAARKKRSSVARRCAARRGAGRPGGFAAGDPMRIRSYSEALRYLALFTDYERGGRVLLGHSTFRLRRMLRLLRGLGAPERDYPVVHVTGSKGKGTTSTLIAALAQAHGLRVGLYTSPHLQDLRERIQVDGHAIPRAGFTRALDVLLDVVLARAADAAWVREALAGSGNAARPIVPDRFPTFFEITTAIALLWFQWQHVDLAVVEVGLGGRLDATNGVRPQVAVITRIELEHTEVLGTTRAAVAREKAGIIKRGVPVITGERRPEALAVIAAAARARGARLWRLGHEVQARHVRTLRGGGVRADFFAPGLALRQARLALLGTHQADNAALAVATVAELAAQGRLAPRRRVLLDALARTVVPARVQPLIVPVRGGERTLVLDTCHTADSARALAAALTTTWPRAPRWLIFGALQGKDIAGMLRCLTPHFDLVLLTPVASGRSWDPTAFATAPGGPPRWLARDLRHALAFALDCPEPWRVLAVAGSTYLAGETLSALDSRQRVGALRQ
ncbi:MAG: hypothetical protein IT514_05735 [Burkholderiales bacterium]|nr:hypothetical protein [Burkholderiales bacterium]